MHPLGPPRAVQAIAAAWLTWTLAGCGAVDGDIDASPDPTSDQASVASAVWNLAPDQALSADTTEFTALVTRLGCNNGTTGNVNEPNIVLNDDAFVITFSVSPGEPGAADCQGNDQVRFEVALPEALGDRDLVDGACSSSEAGDTESCRLDGVRHTPGQPAYRH